MARLISCASGNLTAAATWALVDNTSLLDSEASSATGTTTSYVESQAFTPGAITIDGIAIKVAVRATGSPTSTVSVRLAQGGSLVAGTEVTINTADIAACGNAATANCSGWHFFKFASPVTLLGATAYTVSIKSSAASAITPWRSATAGDWSRMLRTTTTQAPTTGDIMHIMGELTGAGTGNSLTVTMDSTAATDYGPGTDGQVALTISQRGTLTYGTAASTNYLLRLSGNLLVYAGGTLNIGTTGTPIPRTSTAITEFDMVATAGMGVLVRVGATVNIQGLSRSSGKNVPWCLLNTDEAAAQTTLGVDRDTGWLNGDEIVIATTSRTPGDSEARTLNADAGASSISVSAGLTNAHSGTAPTQAEVINLTRNVIFRSTNSARMAFFTIGAGSGLSDNDVSVDIDWCRFQYFGSGVATATAAIGINLNAASTGVSIQYCSFDGGVGGQLYPTGSVYTISNNVFSLLASTLTSVQSVFDLPASAWTFEDNVLIGANTGGRCLTRSATGAYNRNRTAGMSGIGFWVNAPLAVQHTGSCDGNVSHTCGGVAVIQGVTGPITFTGLTIWRNTGGNALSLTTGNTQLTIVDLLMFGNNAFNLVFGATQDWVRLKNPIIAGDSSFSTGRGISMQEIGRGILYIEGGSIGVASGIYVAHTTSDIQISTAALAPVAILQGTTLGSTVEVEAQTNFWSEGGVRSQKHDGTTGSHKAWMKYGIISTDTTAGMYRTSSPSERLAPNNASGKLRSGVKRFAVASGQTATPSVYVRESVAGDGTDYNGNRARLILKANPAAGIAADTVLATASASSEGAFELLSGTTAAVTDDAVLEVYVDCDGTTGWCNVDDWSVA